MKLHSLQTKTSYGNRMATVDVDTRGYKTLTIWVRKSERSIWERVTSFTYTKDEWLEQSLNVYEIERQLKEMWEEKEEENEERV